MHPMKQAIYSSRTADKFVVRLPDGMRERIADVARNHHRSMNSEIISRLEQSLLQEGTLNDEPNLRLDSPEALTQHAQAVYQQAVVLKAMPLNNATQITDAERATLASWFTSL